MTDLIKKYTSQLKGSGNLLKFEKYLEYALLSLVFIFLTVLLVRKLACFDIWFHLKAGQWIFNNRTVPIKDVFSYTASENLWIDSQWLFQLIFWLAYTLGGIIGLQIRNIIIFLLAFYLIYGRDNFKNNPLVTSVFMFLSIILIQERFFIRPETPTILFIALYFRILSDYKYKNKSLLWFLPLIQVSWTNMHGLFIIGIIIMVSVLAGETASILMLSKIKGYEYVPLSPQGYKKLLFVTVITISECFFNPYGIKGAVYPLLLFSEIGEKANAWMKTVGELQPLFQSENTLLILYFCIFVALTIISFLINRKKLNPGYLLIYCGLLYLSLKASRNVAVFAFVAAPIGVLNFSQSESKLVENLRKNSVFKITAAVIMIIFISVWLRNIVSNDYYIKTNDAKRFGFGTVNSLFPEKAVDFIISKNINGNMLNDNGIGGYLIWRLAPDRKVFVDGRWEVYGKNFMDRYKEALTDINSYLALTQKYDINYIILSHISMESRRLLTSLYKNEKWKLVFFDDTASIFIKNRQENMEIIKNNHVDFSLMVPKDVDLAIKNENIGELRQDYENNYFCKGLFFFSTEHYKNSEYEFRRALLINPLDFRAYNNLGNTYQKTGDSARAVDAYMKCLKVSPGFIEAIINLANLYSISGSYSQAISYYNAAIKIQPNNAGNYYGLALAYLKTGDRDKYIEQLRKTISVNPDHFEAHFKLAMIYADSDIETTKKELLEVIRIKPDFAMGYFNIGIACMKLGKKDLTKYYWNKYLGMEHDRSMDQMIIQWIADN